MSRSKHKSSSNISEHKKCQELEAQRKNKEEKEVTQRLKRSMMQKWLGDFIWGSVICLQAQDFIDQAHEAFSNKLPRMQSGGAVSSMVRKIELRITGSFFSHKVHRTGSCKKPRSCTIIVRCSETAPCSLLATDNHSTLPSPSFLPLQSAPLLSYSLNAKSYVSCCNTVLLQYHELKI